MKLAMSRRSPEVSLGEAVRAGTTLAAAEIHFHFCDITGEIIRSWPGQVMAEGQVATKEDAAARTVIMEVSASPRLQGALVHPSPGGINRRRSPAWPVAANGLANRRLVACASIRMVIFGQAPV